MPQHGSSVTVASVWLLAFRTTQLFRVLPCVQEVRERGIKLVEQRLSFLQIGRVEALGEPAVDLREHIASLLALTLLAPETGEARGGAQLQRLRSHFRCGMERLLEPDCSFFHL